MGGKESTQVDSQYYAELSFHFNILVCGDYLEEYLQNDLDNIKIIDKHEGLLYTKKGDHKNIQDWNYFFFPKNKNIGNNTLKYLQENLKKKIIKI